MRLIKSLSYTELWDSFLLSSSSSLVLSPADTTSLITDVATKLNTTNDVNITNSNANDIKDFLLANGYPEIVVTFEEIKSTNDRVTDLKFQIKRAEKIFVGKINITGNIKTEDSLIRKYISVCEGDFFNAVALNIAKQNLTLLNYFSSVQISSAQNAKNTNAIDVNIKVVEKSTMDTTFKAGYGTQSGFYGAANLSEINLFGTGKKVNMMIMKSQNGLNVGADFINSELFGRNIRNGISTLIGSNQSLPLNYTEDSKSISIFGSYNIFNNLTHEISYGLKSSDVTMGLNNSKSTTLDLQNFYTSSIKNQISYDKLDNPNSPKNGYLVSLSQQTAGFGGDNKFFKFESNGTLIKSFMRNNVTLSASFNAAIIKPLGSQDDIKIMDRFVLGDYEFRGFEYGGIGPRQTQNGDSKAIGGLQYYVLTLDLKFPLGIPEEMGVDGHLFVDAGSIWGVNDNSQNITNNTNAMRASVGFGISLNKMVPIRIDFAIPISKQSQDKEQIISFRMGY